MPGTVLPWKPIFAHEVPAEWRLTALRNNELSPDAEELVRARRRMGLVKGEPIVFHVAVEIPDFPMFREWMKWYQSQPSHDLAAIIMTAQDTWPHRPEDLRATMDSLIRTGRPMPIWLGVWGRAPPP